MLPSSKHNLLLNPSQDLLSFHSEADKALQAYSLSETGTTESGLSDLVQRLWSTYQSLSRALPKSE